MKRIKLELTEDQVRTVFDLIELKEMAIRKVLDRNFSPQYNNEQLAYLKRLKTDLRKQRVS